MTRNVGESLRDISKEVADKTRAQVRQIPDSLQDLSLVEERWRYVVKNQPTLRREIARITFEVAPTDAQLRGTVCSALIELMLILENQQYADETLIALSSVTEERTLKTFDKQSNDVYDAVSAQLPSA